MREVNRLCNVIINHVADGKTIFEKDHAAMIDLMREQQREIERLREAFGDLWSWCRNWDVDFLDDDEFDRPKIESLLGATQ